MRQATPLIQVDAPTCLITLDGPALPARGRVATSDPVIGTLRVFDLGGPSLHTVLWRTEDGVLSDARDIGPPLYEETPYTLTVVATNANDRPVIRHRDPTLIGSIQSVRGRNDVATGVINFRSQVGHTAFEISVGGTSLRLELEVFPSKLDYQTDYRDLLSDVEGTARGLVLEYLRATQRTGAAVQTEPGRSVDWLLLLRNEADDLERALNRIVIRPHRYLAPAAEYRRAERIRRPAHMTLRAVIRGEGRGGLIRTGSGVPVRRELPAKPVTETLDTPENRWLRLQLTAITRTLADLRSRPRRAGAVGAAPDPRALAVEAELRSLEEHLAPFLSMSPLGDALGTVRSDFSSLTLLGAEGYREAYQSILRLRMALRVTGDTVELSVKDLSELYEIWCYFAVVRIVADVLGVPVKPDEVFSLDDAGVHVRLRRGTLSRVTLPQGPGWVSVAYNQRFSGLTGAQKPDVIIEVDRAGLSKVILILDAKYRLDASEEFVTTFGGPAAPIDAVNELHRYRDAIVLRHQDGQLGRVVVRGVALFPLSEKSSTSYQDHRLFESLRVLGIGALPFLPSNQGWVAAWIRAVLESPDVDVAWPGPPFDAWEAQRQPGATAPDS